MKWCDECGQRSSREDVCTNCGLVFEDKPIDCRKPRHFKKDDEKVLMNDYFSEKTIYKIKGCKNQNITRALWKYNRNRGDWQGSHKRRNTLVEHEVKRIVNLLYLPDSFYLSVLNCYYKLCKLNENKTIFRKSSSMEIFSQTLVYLQIKLQTLPFSLYDFEKIGCDISKIKNQYSRLMKEIKLKFERQTPSIFVNKIVCQLNLDVRDSSLLIITSKNFASNLEKIEKEMLSLTLFRNPVVKAAGCIYVLGSDIFNIKQKKLKKIVGCDVRTIGKRIQEIKSVLHQINVFGYKEEIFDRALRMDEYEPLYNNGARVLDRDKLLIKGMIDPNYRMEIEDKVVFYEDN